MTRRAKQPPEAWTLFGRHLQLLALIASDPKMAQLDMSATLGLSHRQLSNLLTELAAEGWLEIYRDPDDGRHRMYTLAVDRSFGDGVIQVQSVAALLALIQPSA